MPIGQIIHGASSFADDLALVAPDKQTAEAYLSILEEWCDENFFKVNADKSGILRVGELRNQPDPNFSLKGDRIRLLEEEDPIHEDVERFKYLGFMISSDGKWDDFVNSRIQRCKQALGQYWRFFRLANISVDLKLRAAQALIFSHLAYGDEIVCLTKEQATKIDAIQAKTIKTILQLPKYVNSDAARFITGQVKISSIHEMRCLTNLQRIRNLPQDTQLRKIYEDGSWHKRPFIFNSYEEIERCTRAKLRHTDINDEKFQNLLSQPPSEKSKKVLKDIITMSEKAETSHRLRINHQDLLGGHYHTHTHPMWKRSAPSLRVYNRWTTGGSSANEDLQRHGRGQDEYCRLCESKEIESRDHLLSNC